MKEEKTFLEMALVMGRMKKGTGASLISGMFVRRM